MDIKVLGSSSKGNCYRIDGSSQILLDVGINFKEIQRKLNFKVSSILGVLLTHSHGDHSRSVSDFIKCGIDIYTSQQCALELGIAGHRVKIVESLKQFKVGEWSILPFELEHDVFNLGYMLSNGVEKIAYITDTAYCKYKLPGLTHILIECNHSYAKLDENIVSGHLPLAMKNRLIKTHFALENVKEFLLNNDLSNLQEVHLIHLSDGNSNAEQFKREIAEIVGVPVHIAGG